MRAKMGWIGGLVTGLVAGIMLVVACSDGGRGGGILDGGLLDSGIFDAGCDAHAQAGGCDRWEVLRYLRGESDDVLDGRQLYRMPAGFEPFAADFDQVYLRRCAD